MPWLGKIPDLKLEAGGLPSLTDNMAGSLFLSSVHLEEIEKNKKDVWTYTKYPLVHRGYNDVVTWATSP